MGSEARLRWEFAGGSAPENWGFQYFEALLLNEKSIAVGVMYPGKHNPGGIPLIKVGDVKNGAVVSRPEFCISEAVDHEYRRSRISGSELMITLVGEPGDCALATQKMRGWNAARALAVVKLKDADLRPWLRYVLKSAPAQHLIDSRLNTTVQKTLNLKDIRSLPIPIPPKSEMKSIVGFMTALDEKIELNRQTNQTLEAMAQALFKSWFVDFDPVIDNALAAGKAIPEALQPRAEIRAQQRAQGHAANDKPASVSDYHQHFPDEFTFTEQLGWIPKGWAQRKLGELLDIKYGKDHKKLGDGSVPVYGSGGLMRHVDQSLYSGEAVLVPRKGSLNNIMYVDETFWTVDTMFYSIPKIQHVAKYLFRALSQLDFAGMNVGSAVPSMTTAVLNDLLVLKPKPEVLQRFETALESISQGQKKNDEQTRTLSKLRDTLLPKLISGELRIPDAGHLLASEESS